MSRRQHFGGWVRGTLHIGAQRQERVEIRQTTVIQSWWIFLSRRIPDETVARLPDAPLPPLWHWVAFPEFMPMADLAADGHPERGGFLPPHPFNRRMWAGRKLSFTRQFAIGEVITRRSEILSIAFKSGSTGDMAFMRAGHDLLAAGAAQIRDEQHIVYLPIPDSFRAPRAIPADAAPLFSEPVEVSPVRLFRYFAATCNAHRIHYGCDYATALEHYPGLVVNGPMQATLLMEAAMRHSGATPARFTFRGVHPMFDGSLHLQAEAKDGTALRLCTVAPEVQQGMQARFKWEA